MSNEPIEAVFKRLSSLSDDEVDMVGLLLDERRRVDPVLDARCKRVAAMLDQQRTLPVTGSDAELIERLNKVIGIAGDVLDEADNIIATNCGTDTPREWNRAYQRFAKARQALTGGQTNGK